MQSITFSRDIFVSHGNVHSNTVWLVDFSTWVGSSCFISASLLTPSFNLEVKGLPIDCGLCKYQPGHLHNVAYFIQLCEPNHIDL